MHPIASPAALALATLLPALPAAAAVVEFRTSDAEVGGTVTASNAPLAENKVEPTFAPGGIAFASGDVAITRQLTRDPGTVTATGLGRASLNLTPDADGFTASGSAFASSTLVNASDEEVDGFFASGVAIVSLDFTVAPGGSASYSFEGQSESILGSGGGATDFFRLFEVGDVKDPFDRFFDDTEVFFLSDDSFDRGPTSFSRSGTLLAGNYRLSVNARAAATSTLRPADLDADELTSVFASGLSFGEFTVTAIPEPTGIGALALGGLVLLRRRWAGATG